MHIAEAISVAFLVMAMAAGSTAICTAQTTMPSTRPSARTAPTSRLFDFRVGKGARIEYIQTSRAVPDAITGEASSIPWFEIRYTSDPEGAEQVVAWHTGYDSSAAWKIVAAACDGRIACIVLNEHGFSWVEAWELRDDGLWTPIVPRVRNNKGLGSQGPSASRAEIGIGLDRRISVAIRDANNVLRKFALRPEDFRSGLEGNRSLSVSDDFKSPWVSETE